MGCNSFGEPIKTLQANYLLVYGRMDASCASSIILDDKVDFQSWGRSIDSSAYSHLDFIVKELLNKLIDDIASSLSQVQQWEVWKAILAHNYAVKREIRASK